MEETFAILKPDALERGLVDEILKRLRDKSIQIEEKRIKLEPEKLRIHYAHIADKDFYPNVEAYMIRGDVIIMKLTGSQVINEWRKMMGATKPEDAQMGTIRGDFGIPSDNGLVENLVHGSDSKEAAQRELALWFGNKPKLYSISGAMASGKDTLAKALGDEIGNVTYVAFAGALKDEIDQIFDYFRSGYNIKNLAQELGVSEKELQGLYDMYNEFGPWIHVHSGLRNETMRRILQYWGTQIRRSQDPDYWIKKTLKAIEELQSHGSNVIVTDARFMNEIEAITNHGGKTICLDIPVAIRRKRLMSRDGFEPSMETLTDTSESQFLAYENFDYVFKSGSVAEMLKEILD